MTRSYFARTCVGILVGASVAGVIITAGTTAIAAPIHHAVSSEYGTSVTAADIWARAQSSYPADLTQNTSFAPNHGSFAAFIKDSGGEAVSYTDSAQARPIGLAFGEGNWAAQERIIAAHATRQLVGAGVPASARVYALDGGGTFTGDYEMFQGHYWVSVASSRFTSARKVAPLLSAAATVIDAHADGVAS